MKRQKVGPTAMAREIFSKTFYTAHKRKAATEPLVRKNFEKEYNADDHGEQGWDLNARHLGTPSGIQVNFALRRDLEKLLRSSYASLRHTRAPIKTEGRWISDSKKGMERWLPPWKTFRGKNRA